MRFTNGERKSEQKRADRNASRRKVERWAPLERLVIAGLAVSAPGAVLAGPVNFLAGGGVTDNSIVYDNLGTTPGAGIYVPDRETAERITLAGTDRFVTNLSFEIGSSGGISTADVTVRLYEGGSGATPGALLWNSGLLAGQSFASGANAYDFTVPNVLVPDTLMWSMHLTNIDTTNSSYLGLVIAGAPLVGSNTDGLMIFNSYSGTWSHGNFGPIAYASLGLTITASDNPVIPLPTGAAMAMVGMGVLGVRRRRS